MTDPTNKSLDWNVVRSFLVELYGVDKVEQVWLAGFSDIEKGASWFGMQGLERLKRAVPDPREADLYFCTGLIRAGANNRTLGEVVSQPVLYADDIGTKVDRGLWDTMFAVGFPEPTVRIETSPGNESWVWALDGDPTTDERRDELALIRAYMIEAKLTDALHDPTRYLRLPMGWNSKPKYRGPGERPPSVSSVTWDRGHKVSLDEIGQVLLGREDWRNAPVPQMAMTGRQLASVGNGALARVADAEDPLVRMAGVVGLNPVPSTRQGVIDALCPNMAEHGDRPETGFAFLGGGLCHCNHASCDGLRSPDFAAMIRGQYEDHVSAMEAVGSRPADLPLSAQTFEARASFEQHGVKFGQAVVDDSPAVHDAEEMARRMEVRATQAAEALDAATERLVERFVWVGPVKGFFDTEDRELMDEKQLEFHADVLPHYPAGLSGAKRVCNVLRNHPDRRTAYGVTYKPGVEDPVVLAVNEHGQKVEQINTWTPGGLVASAGVPDAWLDLTGYMLPCDDFRNYALDWLAYQVQFPGKRTPVVLFIASGQGVGKDTWLSPLVHILGAHNVQFVNNTRLESQFNSWQRAKMVVMPELRFGADGALYNKLKDWTGQNAGRIEINGKYAKTFSFEPTANFIGFTNHMDAMRGLEDDDRRIAAYVSPADPKAPDWYKRMAPVIGSVAEAERVMGFLLARDLSNFNPHLLPPDTSGSKAAMLAHNLSDKSKWVLDQFVVGGRFHGRRFLTANEIESYAAVAAPTSVKAGGLTLKVIVQGMKAAGCTNLGQVRTSGVSRASMWAGPALTPRDVVDAKTKGGRWMADQAAAELERIMKEDRDRLLSNMP